MIERGEIENDERLRMMVLFFLAVLSLAFSSSFDHCGGYVSSFRSTFWGTLNKIGELLFPVH